MLQFQFYWYAQHQYHNGWGWGVYWGSKLIDILTPKLWLAYCVENNLKYTEKPSQQALVGALEHAGRNSNEHVQSRSTHT